MKNKTLTLALLIGLLLIIGCSNQSQNNALNGNLPNNQLHNQNGIVDNTGFSNFVPLEYKGTSEDFMIENLGKGFFEKYVSVIKDDECISNGEPECYKSIGYVFDIEKPQFGLFTELSENKTGKFIKMLQAKLVESIDGLYFIPGGQIIFTEEIVDAVCKEDSTLQICEDFFALKKIYEDNKFDKNTEISVSLSIGGVYTIFISEPSKIFSIVKTKEIYVEKNSMKILKIDENERVID